jgi:ElaB/YqjD/DUF883 family membrane-anchored ribosome-binding protein
VNRTEEQTGASQRASQGRSWEEDERPLDREAERALEQLERLKHAGRNLGQQLEQQMRERPYVVLGAAVGTGFVIGSLLGSRLGQMAIALAGGYVARNALMGGGGGLTRAVKEGIDKLTQDRERG